MVSNTPPRTDADPDGSPLRRTPVKFLLKKWFKRKPVPTIFAEQLNTMKDDSQHAMVYCRAYQHPPCYIAQLPVELLCEIFVRCLPIGRYGDHNPTPRIEDAPMLLCHVCSHWRRVALSFTALWSSFSGRCCGIYRNRNPERTARIATQALVQLWLERSRSHPISVDFVFPTLSVVRELLFANVHRWESVAFTLDNELVRELMAIPQAGAPLVENLSLVERDCNNTLRDIPALLLRFPNLRRLYYNIIQTPDTLFPNIPWSQMTHITLCVRFPADQFVTSLSQCVVAEYIDIQWVFSSSTPVQSVPATLPYLAYLRIDSCAGDITLLDGFMLPSLRTLKFDTRSKLTHRNFRALEALAVRSSCTIETFHMEDLTLLEEDLIRYLTLPCLQTVRELKISSHKIFDRTLFLPAYPTMASGARGIFPQLETLHLRYITTTDGLLSDAIASRWRLTEDHTSPTTLTNVKLVFPLDNKLPHDLDILRITRFVEQGLLVSWSWY